MYVCMYRLLLAMGVMWIFFSVIIRIITAVSVELFNPEFVIFWEPDIRLGHECTVHSHR